MPYTQDNRICTFTSVLGNDALLLQRLSGYEGVSQPFSFDLKLLSPDETLDLNALIGTGITVTVDLPTGDVRYLSGIIAHIAQGKADQRFVTYHARIVPWFWLLKHCSDCRIFQNKTVPDIVKEVFAGHNLVDYEFKLSGDYAPRPYCVQYGETDFDFVSRLLEAEGIFYYFRHENGRHLLVLGDAPDTHEPCMDPPDVVYTGTADNPEQDEGIQVWQAGQSLHSGKYALSDYNFETPNISLLVHRAGMQGAGVADALERYDYLPGRLGTVKAGEARARLCLEEREALAVVINGKSNYRALSAGSQFTLQGHFTPEANDKPYMLTRVEHRLEQPADYESGTEEGAFYENRFQCIPHSVPFRPQRNTTRPRMAGPQTATVVGPQGEEIYTDSYGRVKVLFPWDRRGKADENSSCWIRVSESWAGKQWGTLFVPRIGQEVIVEFLEGDPDLPIITGRVYNARNMPPYSLPGEQTKSTLKSLSTQGGAQFNEIRFDDKKDNEELYIHAGKVMNTQVEEDAHETIGSNRHLIIKGDQHEKVAGDKHLTIEGDHNEKVDGVLSIETSSDLQEKAGMNCAVEAGNEIHLKSGVNCVIEAGSSLTLKAGSGFVVIDASGVTVSGALVRINSGGSAGAGSGCTPEPPKPPPETPDQSPGQAEKPPTPKEYGPTALALKQAARAGTPFSEKCKETKKEQE